MKKILLIIATLTVVIFASTSRAALVNDGSMTLTIIGNNPTCLIGGTYPNCASNAFDIAGAGSFFRLSDGAVESPLFNGTGIILGTAQPFDGAYPGAPGENITAGGSFFGVQFPHFTDTAVTAINDTTLDMSGWRAAWNVTPSINLGSGGTATISCGTCDFGDAFTLDYSATIPDGFLNGKSYDLRLEGIITKTSAVPVPAAVWLFGSGLVGLAGFARRRK